MTSTGPNQTFASASRSFIGARKHSLLLAIIVLLFALVTLPVILQGSPLLDDYHNCVAPNERGFSTVFAEVWDNLQLVRPAHYLEVGVTAALCRTVPFGFVILIPWLLTLGVALMIRSFLREVGVQGPWSEIGAGIWLLQPLGTESALWPAALHIPLGLCLALLAGRQFHRGKIVTAALAGLAACLSLEQVVFVLPLIGALAPGSQRRRAIGAAAAVMLLVLITFSLFHGTSPYTDVALIDRVRNIFADPAYYVIFPAIGLGAHAIPLALRWAFPLSLVVLLTGGIIGARVGRALLRPPIDVTHLLATRREIMIAVLALVLINVPVAISQHPDSPRIFTPTWLALSIGLAVVGSRVRWRRPSLWGAVVGVMAGAALLSLSFSSWVRVRSAQTSKRAFALIEDQIPDGGTVAVCDIERTVVEPAPTGDFALHEFFAFTEEAYTFYTGHNATFLKGGRYWDASCPDLTGADLVLSFDEIKELSGSAGREATGAASGP